MDSQQQEYGDKVFPLPKNNTVRIYSVSVDKDPSIHEHGCRWGQVGSLTLQPLCSQGKRTLFFAYVRGWFSIPQCGRSDEGNKASFAL